MSTSFSDGENLQAKARHNLRAGVTQRRRWWCDKYELPPNHPLFLERSVSSLQQEMCEDLLWRQRQLLRRLEDEPDKDGALLEELNSINKALGEEETVIDPLFDKWERELAEGKIPDLDELPEDLE